VVEVQALMGAAPIKSAPSSEQVHQHDEGSEPGARCQRRVRHPGDPFDGARARDYLVTVVEDGLEASEVARSDGIVLVLRRLGYLWSDGPEELAASARTTPAQHSIAARPLAQSPFS
jgi:hypothetical protein